MSDIIEAATSGEPIFAMTPAAGGDVIFTPGKGYAPTGKPPIDGDIVFKDADDNDLLRLTKDGPIVRGEKIAYPIDLLDAMSDFLRACGVVK